jgi:hypothetical protein
LGTKDPSQLSHWLLTLFLDLWLRGHITHRVALELHVFSSTRKEKLSKVVTPTSTALKSKG